MEGCGHTSLTEHHHKCKTAQARARALAVLIVGWRGLVVGLGYEYLLVQILQVVLGAGQDAAQPRLPPHDDSNLDGEP